MRTLPPIETRVNPAELARASVASAIPPDDAATSVRMTDCGRASPDRVADLNSRVVASRRLHGLGLVVPARPDAAGERTR